MMIEDTLFKKYNVSYAHRKKCFRESNLIEDINNRRANFDMLLTWCYLVEYHQLSDFVIKQTHKMITAHQQDLAESDKGQYRQITVRVGARICPPPYIMLELMHNWILDMQDYKNQDPKKMHIRFEKIHPFRDGNGRLGRMLMWWHEYHLGRQFTLIESEKKDEYYKWFR